MTMTNTTANASRPANGGFVKGLEALAGFVPAPKPELAPATPNRKARKVIDKAKKAKTATPAAATAPEPAPAAPPAPVRDEAAIRSALEVGLKGKGVPTAHAGHAASEFLDYFEGASGGLGIQDAEHARRLLDNRAHAAEIERIRDKYTRMAQAAAAKAKAAAPRPAPATTPQPEPSIKSKVVRAKLLLGMGQSWELPMTDLVKLGKMTEFDGATIHPDDRADVLALTNAVMNSDVNAIIGITRRMGVKCIRVPLAGAALLQLQEKARAAGTCPILGYEGRPSADWDAALASLKPKATPVAAIAPATPAAMPAVPTPKVEPRLTPDEEAELAKRIVATMTTLRLPRQQEWMVGVAGWLKGKGVHRIRSPYQDGTRGQGYLIGLARHAQAATGWRVSIDPNPHGLGDEVFERPADDAGLKKALGADGTRKGPPSERQKRLTERRDRDRDARVKARGDSNKKS